MKSLICRQRTTTHEKRTSAITNTRKRTQNRNGMGGGNLSEIRCSGVPSVDIHLLRSFWKDGENLYTSHFSHRIAQAAEVITGVIANECRVGN